MQKKTFSDFMNRDKLNELERFIHELPLVLEERGYKRHQIGLAMMYVAEERMKKRDPSFHYDFHRIALRLGQQWIDHITEDGELIQNPTNRHKETHH